MTTETTTRVELDLTELESLVANTRNNGDIDLVFGPLFRSCLRELGTDTAELLPELLRRARQLEQAEAFFARSATDVKSGLRFVDQDGGATLELETLLRSLGLDKETR